MEGRLAPLSHYAVFTFGVLFIIQNSGQFLGYDNNLEP